jgi:trehalose/maltose hydrolase-like predicted phosphorylase
VLEPRLPKQWKSVSFAFSHHGHRYHVKLTTQDNGKTIRPEPISA